MIETHFSGEIHLSGRTHFSGKALYSGNALLSGKVLFSGMPLFSGEPDFQEETHFVSRYLPFSWMKNFLRGYFFRGLHFFNFFDRDTFFGEVEENIF